MLNNGNSKFLNNFNRQQFEDQMALDSQIQEIVSKILSNNILFQKPLKNKMNNGNSFININRDFPQKQYSNQNQRNNLNLQVDESNFLDLLTNLSLEPSNQKINSIPSFGQPLYENKNPINIGLSQLQQIQQSQIPWTGGKIRQNNVNILA